MPFLPTLATVIVLAAASLFCQKAGVPAPQAVVATVPAFVATFPAPATIEAARRAPAALAFAERYPLVPAARAVAAVEIDLPVRREPATTAAIPASLPSSLPKSAAQLAARRPCPGRRCPEAAPVQTARGPEHPAPSEMTRPGAEELPRGALPYSDTVAEAFVPAVRAVEGMGQNVGENLGRGLRGAVGGAATLLRGGTESVRGSVALLAECLP